MAVYIWYIVLHTAPRAPVSIWRGVVRTVTYEEWQKWGKKYLQTNLRARAKMAEKEMQWFSLQYGLKFSDFPDFGPYDTEKGEDNDVVL
jgi:hypothetical protein